MVGIINTFIWYGSDAKLGCLGCQVVNVWYSSDAKLGCLGCQVVNVWYGSDANSRMPTSDAKLRQGVCLGLCADWVPRLSVANGFGKHSSTIILFPNITMTRSRPASCFTFLLPESAECLNTAADTPFWEPLGPMNAMGAVAERTVPNLWPRAYGCPVRDAEGPHSCQTEG